MIAECPRRGEQNFLEKKIESWVKKKTASLAVCKDSKCFPVRSVHGHGWSTDTVYVHVHSEQVQTRSGFSGHAQYGTRLACPRSVTES